MIPRAGIKDALEELLLGNDLSGADAEAALEDLIANPSPESTAAFMVLMRAKGETADEVAGLVRAISKHSLKVPLISTDVVDIVGTGGDGMSTVNISTGATVLTAAAGVKVAKHGGRSVSSKCGSADVIEAMGIAAELGPAGVARCVEEAGVGFMFAPVYHPAFKHVAPVRKALGLRTAFNMIGPMLNPSGCQRGVIGVWDTTVMRLMADSLANLGASKCVVVNAGGIDELTPVCDATVVEINGADSIKEYTVRPEDYDIKKCTIEDLVGGERELNARMLQDAFGGEKGPVAEALIFNAGFAVAMAENSPVSSPLEGVALVREVQESGKALETLEKWRTLSQEEKAKEEK